jgi:hypothetical protein
MNWYNYTALGVNKTLDSVIEMGHLESYIQNLPANQVLYHGYYSFEKRSHYKEYSGLLTFTFDTVHIDLDSKDDNGATAWEQTKALCKRLQESGCGFQLYFSGNKGFHVAIHKSALGLNEPEAHDTLSQKMKSFFYGLKELYSTVDTSIHDPSRKFRAYRSHHEKSGLYKIRLTGIGLKVSAMTIDEIRNLALMQPVHKYAHPTPVEKPVEFLATLISSTPHPSQATRKSKVKELNQGTTLEDDSLKFKNFADKRCVKSMLEGVVLPQFNRHDIELALIVEMRQQGKSIDEATTQLNRWAMRVYQSEPERIKDVERQVRDVYKRDLEADKLYQFGCYGEIKSAYCSAKCKIYSNLDKKKRPEPLDATKNQKAENEVRRNPSLEKSEGELADEIIFSMPELCKSNGQYFQWINTHWRRIDGDMFEDSLLKVSMSLYGNQAPIKKVKALVEHVIAKIAVAPEVNHFFAASPNKFNFTDCTAKVVKDTKGNLELITYPHDKKDYLAACAPFPLFGKHDLPKGTEFKKYLDTRIQDVGEEGVRIIKQMLGAALIPYAPRIFFIEGITNAGKSTLALLIKRLLGAENVAEVQPVIHGNGSDRFNWEPSIGKLANIVLELDDKKPLDTTVLKMIRDKTLVSVDRKNKGHVRATLPFFHVYCCNSMPPSLEGNSGALNNRVTMLYFKPGYLNGSSGVAEYADFIWDLDASGVLEAAREGLQDLMSSGFKYFENEASKNATKNWQKRNDSIALFIEDIEGKEWNIAAMEGKEWEKGLAIYESFKMWCQSSGKKAMGKHVFYEQLRAKFGWECQQRGAGGVLFRVPGSLKREYEPNANEKNVIITDTIAY